MSRIRNLELLFNLEKKNLKSREDCIVIALHCLLINEHLLCTGIGETWLDSSCTKTELLPKDWNNTQDVYALRYITKDAQTRLLLKITKTEHVLQVDVVKNEDNVASTTFTVSNFVCSDFQEYSSTFQNLDTLESSFREDVLQKLQNDKNKPSSSGKSKRLYRGSLPLPSELPKATTDLTPAREPFQRKFPEVGRSDLDPTGHVKGGGMFLDPSGIGVPPRPTVPKGLPKGSVPAGARFDPYRPPEPDPDYKKPPTTEDSDSDDAD